MLNEITEQITKPKQAFIREVGAGIIFFVLVGVLIGVFTLFGTAINVQVYDNIQGQINLENIATSSSADVNAWQADINRTLGNSFEVQESTSSTSQLLMLGLGMGVIVAVLLGVTMMGAGVGGGGGSRVSF